MLRLFNTFGKRIETFQPVDKARVSVFTCGPSVYQRSHIGNFRTFLFEDIVVRYLEYLGYQVKRGMNFTDIRIIMKDAVLDPVTGNVVKEAVALKIGSFIQTLVDFTIIAFSIFLMVKGINKLSRKKEEAPAAPPAPTRDQELLTEIRDLLKKQ